MRKKQNKVNIEEARQCGNRKLSNSGPTWQAKNKLKSQCGTMSVMGAAVLAILLSVTV